MLATSTLVRRSLLLVPVVDEQAVETSWRHDADAVGLILDPCGSERAAGRKKLEGALAHAGRGGAEIFVVIDKTVAYADLKAAVRSGLTGVILPNAETAQEVEDVAAILREREREEGIPEGGLEIVLMLGTARGIWNVRELVRASARVACAAIDEASLCRSMAIVPGSDSAFDPLSFCRGRVIVETLAAVKLPLGIGHPLGARPRESDPDELTRLADRARNTGFKGAVCLFPGWVAPCNAAFTPTDEQVAYYRDVREAFARGVARGTAAVPFPGGRMIDVPVDERAKLVIDWWERCKQRDAHKAAVRRGLL